MGEAKNLPNCQSQTDSTTVSCSSQVFNQFCSRIVRYSFFIKKIKDLANPGSFTGHRRRLPMHSRAFEDEKRREERGRDVIPQSRFQFSRPPTNTHRSRIFKGFLKKDDLLHQKRRLPIFEGKSRSGRKKTVSMPGKKCRKFLFCFGY